MENSIIGLGFGQIERVGYIISFLAWRSERENLRDRKKIKTKNKREEDFPGREREGDQRGSSVKKLGR